MNETSNSMSNVAARFQKKAEQEMQEIEAVWRGALKTLSENLISIAKREAHTIERIMAMGLLKAWLRPIVVGLLILLGICGGSWGLTQWLSSGIQARLQIRSELEAEIIEQRLTVQQLQETTWGVRFHEEENGRFLVLPQGTVPATGWTVGGQPAVKLSSE